MHQIQGFNDGVCYPDFGDEQCTCSNGTQTFYQDPFDEEKFFHCQFKDSRSLHTCPRNQIFNMDLQRCEVGWTRDWVKSSEVIYMW